MRTKFITLLLFFLAGVIVFFLLGQGSRQISVSNPGAQPIHSVSPKLTHTPTPLGKPSPLGVITSVEPEIVRGDTTKKQVIFTFDGGAGTQSFHAIIDTLAKHQIKGTFFLTGQWAQKNPSLVKTIADNGHEIFNHTFTHPRLSQLSDDEIVAQLHSADRVITAITGVSTKPYFRPPYGDRNARVLEAAASAGYRSVFWSVDALDWEESTGFTPAQGKNRILSGLKPGTIYLMHIGDTITGQILDEVFANIIHQGYTIVPLGQGLQ